ncbi:IS630 family transposase, partial [Brucella endophytica]
RLARRANALLLLDDGLSCAKVAKVLFLDDDTVRGWYESFRKDGLDGLIGFGMGGSAGFLSAAQAEQVKAYVRQHLPRSTSQIGAFIAAQFGISYESRSGLIKLLHRLDLEYRKPEVIGRHLDEDRQKTFIAAYERLLNALGPDEAVLFADAVHPTHAVRPAGCWVVRGQKPAIGQTTGRQRLNIHGAIDLETGQTRMIEAESIDAASTIRLLESLERLYPAHTAIHVFLDNARYHHAVLVQEWLARSKCRIKLHFVPAYCPHLNPIERLWGLMHKHVTHNKGYRTFNEFADKILAFLRQKVPRNWDRFRD